MGRPSPSPLRRIRRQLLYIVPDPADIQSSAPVLVPFLIVVIMNFIGARAVRNLVAPPGQSATAIDLLFNLLAFLSPIIILVKALAATTVTWAVLTLMSVRARLRTLMSIHMYCAMPLALPPIVMTLFVRYGGAGSSELQNLRIPLGLDLLLDPGLSPAAVALVQQVTFFHVLWAILLCWLLRRGADVPGRTALVVALALWGLGTGFAVIRAMALPA